MASLGFSLYSVMSSENSNSFTSSFPIGIHFIYFFGLISVTRISNARLNKHVERGHPCIVSYLRGNAFSFSPLSMLLVVGLSCMAFIILRYVLSILTLWRMFFL